MRKKIVTQVSVGACYFFQNIATALLGVDISEATISLSEANENMFDHHAVN